MSLMSWFRRKRERYSGLIEIERDLVRVVLGHEATTMRWWDILRIEAGRKPTATVDAFYVRLTDSGGYHLVADDLMKRFSELETAIFLRWPDIQQRWVQIYNGPPNKTEHEVLWQREAT